MAARKKPADNLDSLGLPELRQLATAQGWSTLTKANKTGIIKTLREYPDGPPAVAAAAKSEQTNGRTYRPVTPGLSGNGKAKAAHIAGLLKDIGWSTKLDGRTITARRGEEVLTLVWTEKGRHDADASGYVRNKDGASRRVINVASALRFARSIPAA